MFSFFERLAEPYPERPFTAPPKGLFAFCRYYTKGMEIPLIFMSLLTAAVAILEVSLFSFMGDLVDWLSTKDPETLFEEEGSTLILMALVPLVILPIAGLLHSLITHQTLLGNYPMAIRWLAHRYLLRQSVNFYANDFAGRIATKVMQTSLSVRESVMKLLNVMMFIIVYFISMVVLVAQADLRLALPMLIWLALYIATQCYFVPKLKRISTEQAEARSMMTGRIVDSYSNIATVKLFSHTSREGEYAKEGMDAFLDTVHKQMRLVTLLNFCIQTSNHLLSFSVAALSLWLWSNDLVSVGAIAVAISLALRLNGMAHWVMWEISALFENVGTVVDGMETLSQPLEIEDKSNASTLKVQQGKVAFNQVDFHYGGTKKVVEQLSLEIKPGERIGLVGRSGAGKSTLVNLLMRFFDVESGKVTIDGVDVRDCTQDSLRANIGMVTQDTALLHRSVRENLMYGRPEASEEEMIAAAKQAEAHDFILNLSDPKGRTGYDAQVGERGVKLSGGQRQRIALARVLLKNAPILILDEATSALDSEVEAAIQASLDSLMEEKTVIAIAHRLSTIAALDRLIVLDEGNVVEQGTHSELIAQKGIYAQLWAHQTGGFLGEE